MAVAAVIGKILGVVGGIAGGVANMRNELARASQMRFEGQMAQRNAEMARQDQLIRAEQGVQERSALGKEEMAVRGEARASYAAGNVQLDEGTPLEYDIAQAEQYAAAKAKSKDEQALDIHRLKVEEQGLLAEARMKRKAARSMKRSARVGFVGDVLTSIGGQMGK